jgi:CDP-paratose 2-epimerase
VKILLTGACGFVGSALARALRESRPDCQIIGLDNFIRPGSEVNRDPLRQLGVRLVHGDVRAAADIDALPAVDWVIDAAANPSVLAGVDGQSSSRQAVEHNLFGTVNMLEYCRRHGAGFVLLSTSRVYSIPPLAALPVEAAETASGPVFQLKPGAALPPGVSARGLDESFSVAPPISLYGATKLASEALALEYGHSFNFPVWVNRCGVLAGAGQFGRPDQGILAYWINAFLRRQPLRYIGFGGGGAQVRDAFHPRDLAALLVRQLESAPDANRPALVNIGGGAENTFSLASLSAWCAGRFGFEHPVAADPRPRAFDIPWMVMDSALAETVWAWRPQVSLGEILEEIARHAEQHPDWLRLSAPLS